MEMLSLIHNELNEKKYFHWEFSNNFFSLIAILYKWNHKMNIEIFYQNEILIQFWVLYIMFKYESNSTQKPIKKIKLFLQKSDTLIKILKNGSAGARTQDLSVISTTLYLLSYETFTFQLEILYKYWDLNIVLKDEIFKSLDRIISIYWYDY